ncbi:early secretory antigenic target ESAT-6 [Lentzea albidocapillata subsp. violacea]|uniref:ESAT-6-like protein n=1 Tax=Lentzea albidocapillata subsp. violacea TaxID=128104 RepID=A0A1G8VZ06_9PSEU|nr:WXG100 family type VII secretion target [Lentzea albidocapillata]SDJ71219.1 early secretory antigenic target ESAT-6 [Lentzea albidocapillata subsp. violacea]
MSGQIQVTFAEVANAASQISSAAKSVDQQLDDLRTKVTSTLSGYTGDAATQYQAAQDKWDKAAADLQAVLAAIGTAVQQSGEAYEQAERQNQGRW